MKKISLLKGVLLTGIILSATFVVPLAQDKKQTAAKPPQVLNYQAAIDNAYNKYKDLKEGKNADYIKELANVDPNIFGVALVTTDGQTFTKGDLTSRVSIQSISKVFTLARVIEEQGAKAVMDKIGCGLFLVLGERNDKSC